MKTCSKCRSEMISGITDVNFTRNGLHIVLKNVPASICVNCGHKTLKADIALYIDHVLQAFFDIEQPIRMREVILTAS